MQTYKVYAKVDAAGRILALNSNAFLPDPSGWTLIDEGTGDRYHHAQGNYLGRILDDHGVPAFKLVDGMVMRRTVPEMEAEIEPEENAPSLEARISALETAGLERDMALMELAAMLAGGV